VDDQAGITETILLLALAPTVLHRRPADEGIFLKYSSPSVLLFWPFSRSGNTEKKAESFGCHPWTTR
ncbi:uncharacterized protein METZ01_LOCUS80810, partial [marine metagenome]